MIDLSSKTAVVTGAGQGVGLGIATAMAKKGAKVAMLGRTFSKVKNESSKLNEAGFVTLPLECDVKDQLHLKKKYLPLVERVCVF